jgi:hypothetical protein
MREVYSRSQHSPGSDKIPQSSQISSFDGNTRTRAVFFYRRRWQSRTINVVRAISEGKRIRKMTMATIDVSIGSLNTDQPPSRDQEQLDQFANWFSRSRNTLHYMADLILRNSEMADHAVQTCRQKASRNLTGSESEGEFRSWVFRLLIDEALKISSRSY